jgi:trimeric autotransporter adhesin
MIVMRFFLLICVTVVAYAQGTAPVIVSASPNPVDAGGPAFTLTVHLGAFVPGAVVQWSGTPLDATYVDSSTLTATVPAGLIAICGKYLLTVTGSTVSNSYAVIVKPVLQSVSPNQVPAGTNGFTVTAAGLGFSSNVYLTIVSGSQVNLATSYGGTTTLTASVPANALTGAYPVSIFVTDPTTGAFSPQPALPINLTFASVTRIVPAAIYAGIASLDPGQAYLTLGVGGANFAHGAQVLWNGTPLTTGFYNSNVLYATVPAALVHDAGPDGKSPRSVRISVKNPGATGSNSINLVIYPDPYGTTITSLSPASGVAGGPGFTLTVTGERFLQGSTVLWGPTPLPTTFVSGTQLTATVAASQVAIPGAAAITVSTPGVASSNVVSFPIVAVAPTVSSISPTYAIVGGSAFTLTVNGGGFIPASQLTGLAGAATTYVSLNQLSVSVPASAIAAVGSYPLLVVNGPLRSPQGPVFIVRAAPPVVTSLSPASAPAGGADFILTVTGSAFSSSAAVQWNGTPLATTFVSASQLTAKVPAALTAAAGTASVTVTGDGGPSNTAAFTIAPLVPATTPAGIVNAASSQPAIAPGALIAIFGSNLAAGTAQFTATPLPVLLGNTSVSINGVDAPLLFVSPGQVNVQVPYETKAGAAKVVIKSNGVLSPEVDIQVAPTGPGVFTTPKSNHVLARNLADGTLNAADTPARPGQYVTAYLTGQGLVNPTVTAGDVAPASPFSYPLAAVEVRIGGITATVQFAGLAPGFVSGLLQMNILIPDVPAGEPAFDVSVGGVAAASTVISIAAKP